MFQWRCKWVCKVTPAKPGKHGNHEMFLTKVQQFQAAVVSSLHSAESGSKPNQMPIVCRVLRRRKKVFWIFNERKFAKTKMACGLLRFFLAGMTWFFCTLTVGNKPLVDWFLFGSSYVYSCSHSVFVLFKKINSNSVFHSFTYLFVLILFLKSNLFHLLIVYKLNG